MTPRASASAYEGSKARVCRSEPTHPLRNWCHSNRDRQTHSLSLSLSEAWHMELPSLMKLTSFAQRHHTPTDQRGHEPFVKVTSPDCFLPDNLAFSQLGKLILCKPFANLISTYRHLLLEHDGTPISPATQRDALCFPHLLPLV